MIIPPYSLYTVHILGTYIEQTHSTGQRSLLRQVKSALASLKRFEVKVKEVKVLSAVLL